MSFEWWEHVSTAHLVCSLSAKDFPFPDPCMASAQLKAMLRADTVSDKDMEALYNVLQGNELDQARGNWWL